MKNKLLIISLLFAIALSGCSKNKCGNNNEFTGILRDYRGQLDGCAWMIELDNGRRLEVRTVPAGVTLTDGKKVSVKYQINNNTVSICMAGEIADITSLRYL